MTPPDAMDRLGPTRRPSRPVVGWQRWQRLLFLHWPVDAEALRRVVPASLDIDTFQGVAYVGLVPLVMRAIRPAGVPEALGLTFLETNLRTYVHIQGRDPAVYFFSLDASSRIAVEVARRQSGLPYHHARMRLARQGEEVVTALRRRGPDGPSFAARYRVGEPLGPSRPDTLEHFLLERYLLHVERAGTLWTMQVHHQPYPAQRADVLELREGLCAAAGLPPAPGLPPLVHYAAGVDVEIFGPWRAAIRA